MPCRGISLEVARGETVAIVGESGSGKSQAMLAVLGLTASNGRVSGSARYRGTELIGLDQRGLNAVRGAKITIIFQEPMTSLDPLYPIGYQIEEPLIYHSRMKRAEAKARVIELLNLVGINDPERRLRFLSAPAFRRPAPARHDRHGARQRSRHPHRRRADHRARRHHSGADPRADRRSPPPSRHGGGLHHPRPRHRRSLRRPRLCHACRRDRGERRHGAR